MIRRIRIQRYKSFLDFSLEMKPLTVMFGPNASGKSNFLDALYLISRLVTQKNLNEAFSDHRGLPLESFYYADVGYDKLLERKSIKLKFEVDIALSQNTIKSVETIVRAKRSGMDVNQPIKKVITEQYLKYEVEIEALTETGYLRVTDERLCAVKRTGEEKKRTPFIERSGEKIHLRMEGQSHPTYFEQGLDHTVISTPLYEPQHPHITAFRMELANWHTYYLEPRTLMRDDVPMADVDSIGPRGQNLAAFLNTLKHKFPRDFDNLNLTLHRILPSNVSIDVDLLKEGRVGLKLSENSIRYSARLISEGTLRLIGLLCAIHPRNPSTLVAFEEPENGIHPVRIKMISDLLKNTAKQHEKQIVITTHSGILSSYFNDANLFVCSRREKDHMAQTDIRPFKTLGPLFRGTDIGICLEDRIIRGDFGG